MTKSTRNQIRLVSNYNSFIIPIFFKITDHRRAPGDGSFSPDVEIVRSRGSHEGHVQMGVSIDPSRHHVLAPSVNHSGSRGWRQTHPDRPEEW